MNKPKKCDTLLETLSVYFVGRVNQVKSADLARLFELEPKQIQELVHTLRREGHPICGDRDGYYYASCDADIERTARWLMMMGWKIQETACIMLAAANLDRNAPCALAIMREAVDTL
jgi:predicted DNA-binding transcriptional regulator YafY